MPIKLHGLLAATAIGTLGIPATAFAQTSNPQPSAPPQSSDGSVAPVPASEPSANQPTSSDSDIVVTALRRSESVQRVPAAITAVSAQTLQDRGISRVEDLKFAVPSLQVGSLVGNTSIAIRGVGLNLVLTSAPPAVAIHVDGVYQPITTLGDLTQVDLERVEVLRGPQGTLYGRNANAGAVNFITKAPTDRLEGYIQGGYATYNESRVQGMINVPLGDNLRVRAVADWKDRRDGFVQNVLPGGQDVDAGQSLSGRIRVAADLAPNFTFDLNVAHAYQSGPQFAYTLSTRPSAGAVTRNPFLGAAIVPLEPRRTAINDPIGLSRQATFVSGTFALDLGKVKLKSISGYQLSRDIIHGDDDATNISGFVVTRTYRDKTFTQEITLSAAAGPVNAVVGGFYMNEDYFSYIHYDFPNGLAPLPANSKQDILQPKLKTEVYAGFGDATLNVTDRFRLIAGIRFSRDRIASTQHNSVTFGGAAPTITCPLQTNEAIFESTTPRAGAQYDLSNNSNMYATFSKGFKDGGFNRTGCNARYNPEKITAYEVGFKNRFLDNKLTLNLAAFYYDYTDLQLQQQVGLVTLITNAATARVKGLEIEAVWQPNDHWMLNANATFLDAKYKSYSNVDTLDPTLGLQNVAGNPLNNSPREAVNLGLSYRTSQLSFGRLTFRGDVSQRARTYFREFERNVDSQSPFAVVNFNLIWDSPDSKYRVRIYANNLFQADYITSLAGVDAFGARSVSWGSPRQIGAEFRANF